MSKEDSRSSNALRTNKTEWSKLAADVFHVYHAQHAFSDIFEALYLFCRK